MKKGLATKPGDLLTPQEKVRIVLRVVGIAAVTVSVSLFGLINIVVFLVRLGAKCINFFGY